MINDLDKLRAIKISQTLQDYFNKNKCYTNLKSTEAYDILVIKKIVDRDWQHVVKFRKFLNHLKKNGDLDLIPQCVAEKGKRKFTTWTFHSEPTKTISAKNLRTASQSSAKTTLNKSEIKKKIELFPKRETPFLTDVHLETRKIYKRAYEIWTKDEDLLLICVVEEIKNIDSLSMLFQRQPRAVQARLKKLTLERKGI